MSVEESISIGAPSRRVAGARPLRQVYDLLLLAGLAPLLPGLLLLPLPGLRAPLGLALVLLAPGYALAAAIFPRRADLDGVARAAASFGLSVVTLPVLALLLDALPWGIRPWPIALALTLWIALFCGIALWRRLALARSGTTAAPFVAARRSERRQVKVRSVIGVLALIGALIAGALALFIYGPQAPPTEFYVLGAQGLAQDYPRQAALGDELAVTLGIVNREREERNYRIEVWSADARQPDRRALVRRVGPLTLAPGQRLEQPISWRMPWAGDDQTVELLLFVGDRPPPYRQLRLWLDVAAPAVSR